MTLATAPDVLTVKQLAQILQIGRNAAYEFVRSGGIESFRVGDSIRIPRRAVADLLGETPRVATAEAGEPSGHPDDRPSLRLA